MSDLRPDVAFVVSDAVWRDFVALRARWGGEPLSAGFQDDCVARIRQAIRAGDQAAARHWRRVKSLGRQYGRSWVSAVEVDGAVIRETRKFHVLRYPEDERLVRVFIDAE
jgi:hypothetical protein